MTLQFKDLIKIVSGDVIQMDDDAQAIAYLQTDSRRLSPVKETLFFAIRGTRHDGHDFIESLLGSGVNQFIVDKDITLPQGTTANILKVHDSLEALQKLSAYKRSRYQIPVVGITGSNGKTIVKEWLAQMMSPHKVIIKSPGSYNSQIGVPISVWGIAPNHELGIFEAGISQVGEMTKLKTIIQPVLGIFTNIGSAHDEGFDSRKKKVAEKALLFEDCEKVIYCKDYQSIDAAMDNKGFSWGQDTDSDVVIKTINKADGKTLLTLVCDGNSLAFTLPFTNSASVENAMHCVAFMLLKQYDQEIIQQGLDKLRTVKMRMELKRGLNGCQLIDDTYNNDLGGLRVALDFLSGQQQQSKKTIIISDLLQTGVDNASLYSSLYKQLDAAAVDKIIAIGPEISAHVGKSSKTVVYASTDDFLKFHDFSTFDRELILIKGARRFLFEKIVKRLEEKIHGTHLDINLDALTHNLNFYKSKLQPGTKLMVMVKAFAYGSGSLEVANLLQHNRVDYLGVAYADEGVTLRKNGITIPIMVMNPTEDSFEKLMAYDLEPEIYNPGILDKLIAFAVGEPTAIHLKLDTGMHRLGFKENEVNNLIKRLSENSNITVKSIFSHLAGADEASHNSYSHKQASIFLTLSEKIKSALKISPLCHIVNSPGIIRFPEYHFDMVRLGIGLYGIETTNNMQNQLEPISSLKTIVSQVNELKAGDTVGYSRKGQVDKDMRVATIAIGYADGFSRAFSNGSGHVFIHGQKAPIIGNVCMDMSMVDVSHIPNVQEGDEVEIFGRNLHISEVAQSIDTIPYEILTSVSQRVKRIYFTE